MGMRIVVPPGAGGRSVDCDMHLSDARDALERLLLPLGLDYRVKNATELEVIESRGR